MTQYASRFGAAVQFNGIPTGNYRVNISGIGYFVAAGSLKIDLSIGRRSQASFIVYSITHFFQQYQPVSINDQSGNLVFTGYITTIKEQKLGFGGIISHTISACDQHFLADKRIISKVYTGQTCGTIVTDIVNTILSQEGVTLSTVFDGLIPNSTLYPNTTLYPNGNVGVIPTVTFSYCTVAQALDQLVTTASTAGVPYYWMIDQYKKLYFVPYTAITNGNVVDGTFVDQVGTPCIVQHQNPKYRNREYLTGGIGQTPLQTETRKGDGNTTSWNMGYALYSAPTITVNGTGQTVAVKGSPDPVTGTPAQFYWAQGDNSIAQNSSATALTTAQTLIVKYVGQYNSIVISSNNTEILRQKALDGTSGIVEAVDDDQTLVDLNTATLEASRLLSRYGVAGTSVQFTTLYGNTFVPGQLILVDLPAHNINKQQMLIETVSISDSFDNLNIWYTVTAILGPYDTTWVSFFSQLIGTQQPASTVSVGTNTSSPPVVTTTVSYDATTRFRLSSGVTPPTTMQRYAAFRMRTQQNANITNTSQSFTASLTGVSATITGTATAVSGGGTVTYPIFTGPSSPCSNAGITAFTTKSNQPIRIMTFKDNDNIGPTSVSNSAALPYIWGGNILMYWADIETSDSQRDWTKLENTLNLWHNAGKKAIVRLSTCGQAGWTTKFSASQGTPSYVFNLGVPKYNSGVGGTKGVVPQYWNSIFQTKFDAFVSEFAAKYDGDPRIEFVQAAVGMGGESKPDTTSQPGKSDYQTLVNNLKSIGFTNDIWFAFIKHVADLYKGQFTKTPLCFIPGAYFDSTNFGTKHTTADVVNYVKANFGLQNDGIGSGSSAGTPPDPNWSSAKFISAEQRNPTTATGDSFECDVEAIISFCAASPTIYALCFASDLSISNNLAVIQKYASTK